MPGPGAAGPGFFHDHLRMVMIDLATENPFGGGDDGIAARKHAVNGVTGVVPEGKTDNLAAAVVTSECVVVKSFVLLRRTPKQVDFLRIEHTSDKGIAFLLVFSELIWIEGSACHKGGGFFVILAPHTGRHKRAAKPQPEKDRNGVSAYGRRALPPYNRASVRRLFVQSGTDGFAYLKRAELDFESFAFG